VIEIGNIISVDLGFVFDLEGLHSVVWLHRTSCSGGGLFRKLVFLTVSAENPASHKEVITGRRITLTT
jgi:hypothetical protein